MPPTFSVNDWRRTIIAATANALYGRATAFGELGRPGGTLSEQPRRQRIPPESAGAPAERRAVTDQFAELEGDVTIVPDPRTNSLLILAGRWDFDLIHALVQELDIRPLQVLIEVVIAEVRRDRGLDFGVEAVLPPQTIRGTDTEVSAATDGTGLGALVVQFRDVGTRLTVVPTVSADGYVMLEVVREVNAATAEVAFDAPGISTRSIQTRLLVHDGHTASLGGLADRQRDMTRSGVPLRSAIPPIGGSFGRHATRTVETELFVFLTPRVIRTDKDLDEISEEAGDRTRELRRRW